MRSPGRRERDARAMTAMAILIALTLLLSRKRGPASCSGSRPEEAPPATGSDAKWLPRVLLVLATAFVAAGIYGAVYLTRQAAIPQNSGSAQLLVPVSSLTDRFSLHLDMPSPGSKSVTYSINIGCGSRAQDVLLVLTGATRLDRVDSYVGSEAGLAPIKRDLKIGSRLFESPQDAQVFDFPVVSPSQCPRQGLGLTFGTGVGVTGLVERSFETSGAATHSVQLPAVGSSVQYELPLPPFRGQWAADAWH